MHRLPRTWQRDGFSISTGTCLPLLEQLNNIFAQNDFSWGKPLDDHQLRTLIKGSICFAIWEDVHENSDAATNASKQPRLVGLGRWITDDVSVVYINDIYVLKEYRNKGLATWMLACMNEQLSLMPNLRGTILIVQKGSSTELLYKKHLEMEDLAAKDVLLVKSGPGEIVDA